MVLSPSLDHTSGGSKALFAESDSGDKLFADSLFSIFSRLSGTKRHNVLDLQNRKLRADAPLESVRRVAIRKDGKIETVLR